MSQTRRDFLKSTALGLASAALVPAGRADAHPQAPPNPPSPPTPPGMPPAFGTGPSVGPEVTPRLWALAGDRHTAGRNSHAMPQTPKTTNGRLESTLSPWGTPNKGRWSAKLW